MLAPTKTIETSQGSFTVRGLKRGEIKALKAQGIPFGMAIAPEKLEEVTEKSLALCLSPAEMAKLDEMYEAEILELYNGMTALSYASGDQEKN